MGIAHISSVITNGLQAQGHVCEGGSDHPVPREEGDNGSYSGYEEREGMGSLFVPLLAERAR